MSSATVPATVEAGGTADVPVMPKDHYLNDGRTVMS